MAHVNAFPLISFDAQFAVAALDQCNLYSEIGPPVLETPATPAFSWGAELSPPTGTNSAELLRLPCLL